MAKRAGRLEARQNKLRSSKGFLTQQSTDKIQFVKVNEEETNEIKLPKSKDDKVWICPFKECGRRFVSEAQLNTHISRRHKEVKIEEPPKKNEK